MNYCKRGILDATNTIGITGRTGGGMGTGDEINLIGLL